MKVITLTYASKFPQDAEVRRARLAGWREGGQQLEAAHRTYPVIASTLWYHADLRSLVWRGQCALCALPNMAVISHVWLLST